MRERKEYPPRGMSNRIQIAMGKADVTIADMVRATGKSRNTINAYVYGDTAMNVTTLMTFCRKLNVTSSWLIYGKEGK